MTSLIDDELILLWDKLADFPASKTDRSLDFLLSTLCEWLHADRAVWLGAIRVRTDKKDALNGWRPRAVHNLGKDRISRKLYNLGMKALDSGHSMPMLESHVKFAGKFRVYTRAEFAPIEYFESDYYKAQQSIQSDRDVLYAVAPVNRDAESYFLFSRWQGDEFSEEDKALASNTLKGLKWFFRRIMLHHGLMLADTPLTATERQVLSHLVSNLSEKQIAEKIDKKIDTTHQHVKSIYRKFNVNSRPALMAIWLGSAPS